MATILFKDGMAHRIDSRHVQAHLQNGYTTELAPVIVEDDNTDAELEAARELYEEKFGKKAHHKKTFSTIMAELEESND